MAWWAGALGFLALTIFGGTLEKIMDSSSYPRPVRALGFLLGRMGTIGLICLLIAGGTVMLFCP